VLAAAVCVTALCWLLLSVLQPCVGCCCLYYSLVLAAVCVTAFCWLLLSVLQPSVGCCCLCYSLVLAAAVCVTALCWLLLSVLQPCVDCCCLCCNLVLGALRITKKSMEQLQSPGAEMCGPTVIMERRMQIHWIPLSKLAFKGGFCVQKIDGVLS